MYSISSYWVFQSWGRTGTVIGSKKLQAFASSHQALSNYCSLYVSKTANIFDSPTFQKQPNKFYHLDVDVELPVKTPKRFYKTNLSKPVYDLMQLLFDITKVENTMVGCDLNLREMPLGKISTRQMKMAMATLRQIETLIQRNGTSHELLAASNKFYTLIPHAVGINRPPIIDSIEGVTAKHEMLESLLNVDIIHDFLDAKNAETIHPFDLCYIKLNASIEPIEKHDPLFLQLCEVVRSTSESYSKLQVLEIFEVKRVAEIDHDDCHINWKLRNHQLLWHGSRLLNFATILSNGLKVGPPEALANGKLYGNGIYFADAVSRAVGYCFEQQSNNVGLLLLCEVALGIPIDPSDLGRSVVDLPNEENQSIKAIGHCAPNQYQEINRVRIACGSAMAAGNVFVVFDPNQVKIKYLFKIKL